MYIVKSQHKKRKSGAFRYIARVHPERTSTRTRLRATSYTAAVRASARAWVWHRGTKLTAKKQTKGGCGCKCQVRVTTPASQESTSSAGKSQKKSQHRSRGSEPVQGAVMLPKGISRGRTDAALGKNAGRTRNTGHKFEQRCNQHCHIALDKSTNSPRVFRCQQVRWCCTRRRVARWCELVD